MLLYLFVFLFSCLPIGLWFYYRVRGLGIFSFRGYFRELISLLLVYLVVILYFGIFYFGIKYILFLWI